MTYIRQLLIKCKDKSELTELRCEIQLIEKIECIKHSVILECINTDKYSYIKDSFDFSLMLYFESLDDIDKYCSHPIHCRFVRSVLPKIDLMILDYSAS